MITNVTRVRGKLVAVTLFIMGSRNLCQLKTRLERHFLRIVFKRKFGHSHQCYSKKDENIMNVFDRKAKRLQRDRSTTLPNFEESQYVKEEVKA